ncbi:MAG: molybdenum cofactor biosynthesis protein B [Phycisphaerae bacterium]
MPADQHKQHRVEQVTCVVLTISDTRTVENDTSGQYIREALKEAGHQVLAYAIIPDDPNRIGQRLMELAADPDCRAIVLTGGTGLASRDTTFEAVTALLDKRLDGFGELFRMLSYDQIGPGAMLSRAVAGSVGNTALFSLPGSTKAVELAMEKLILPELGHIVQLLGD